MFNCITYIAIIECIKLKHFIFRYQRSDYVSDCITKPVSWKTFNKSEYRGTKES